MAGTLTISTLSDGTNSTSSTNCIKGPAKVWCAYNGTTQAIIGSFNVSSVTYNGAGDYTFNFTTAFSAATYSAVATTSRGDTANGTAYVFTVATTSVRARSVVNTATAFDTAYYSISCFGN